MAQQGKLDLEEVVLDLEPVSVEPSPVKPSREQIVAEALKGNYPTNKPGHNLQGQPVDINNRPDSSLFSLNEGAKTSWRDSVAKNLGEGYLPTWLAELPIAALDAFSTPESLLIPSAINRGARGIRAGREGRQLRQMEREGVNRIPNFQPVNKSVQKALPQGVFTPVNESQVVAPSINEPIKNTVTKGIRGNRGRFEARETLEQPKGGFLDVESRKVYDAYGRVIPQGAGKVVTINGDVVTPTVNDVPRKVQRTVTQLMDSIQPNTGNPELDAIIQEFRQMENVRKARSTKGFTEDEFIRFGEVTDAMRNHPAFPKELNAEWNSAPKAKGPNLKAGDQVRIKNQAAIQNEATTNRSKLQRVQGGKLTPEPVIVETPQGTRVNTTSGEELPLDPNQVVTRTIKNSGSGESKFTAKAGDLDAAGITPEPPVLPRFTSTKKQPGLSGAQQRWNKVLNMVSDTKPSPEHKFGTLKSLLDDESGIFDPEAISKGLKKLLGGTVDDSTIIAIRQGLVQAARSGREESLSELYAKNAGKVSEEQFSTLVDDFLESGKPSKEIEITPEGAKISALVMDKKRGIRQEIMNLPRAIQSSWDASFPLRQGLGLIHKKAWWKSWEPMVRALGSEKAFRLQQEAIRARPLFKNVVDNNGNLIAKSYADEAGLQITDLNDLATREEQIMSTWAETGGNIPYLSAGYRNTMGRGVRASNRAYTAFANELRAGTFEELIKTSEKLGLKPQTNLKLGEDIANFVNSASGRGSLGRFEKHAELLNAALFSPRLQASRIQMIKDGLNYKNYLRAMGGDPQARLLARESLKSVWSMVGAWTAMAGMAKMAGAEVSMDPSSSDFGKIKIGNTRLDPGAGLQQYLVLMARMGPQGKYTSSTSGKSTEFGSKFGFNTRADAGLDFLHSKSNPWATFAWDMLDAKKDQPFPVADQTVRMIMPMLMQDIIDAAAEDPSLIPFALPSVIGLGTNTYGDKTRNQRRNPGMFGENDINFKGGSLGF